jgi:hypothetical protein
VPWFSAICAQEDILRCLYSISDNNSFLLFNRDPIDRMIGYLRSYFRPEVAEPGCSLAISGGLGAPPLTPNPKRSKFLFNLPLNLHNTQEPASTFSAVCNASMQCRCGILPRLVRYGGGSTL